ncbi:unnamed protein product [Penicillium glandicola]
MSSPAVPKEKLFPGISATETKLLVLANVCMKNDKIDYDKLASNAGIKASSAQTLFRNAKRKLDKLFLDDNADADGNGVQADLSPEETPSKRGKSNATPRTPKTPKAPKAPKTPKATKATKATKTAKATKGAADSDESPEHATIKSEDSPDHATADSESTSTTKSAVKLAEDTTRETAVVEPFTETAATAEATKLQTEKEDEGNDDADENDEAALDLAVNKHLPESPLPEEGDDIYDEEAAGGRPA